MCTVFDKLGKVLGCFVCQIMASVTFTLYTGESTVLCTGLYHGMSCSAGAVVEGAWTETV